VASGAVSAVEDRYGRGTLWAAIFVMVSWHLGAVLPTALQSRTLTRPPEAGLALWALYAVVGAGAAVVILRGGGRGAWLGVALCPPLLAGVFVGGFTSPTGSLFDRHNWSFSAVGWFALIVLWRRPLRELVGFFVATAAIGISVMAIFAELDSVSLSRFITLLYGCTVLQIAILVGARALTDMARRTAQAQAAEAEIVTRQLAAQTVHQERRDRYQTVQIAAAELLSRLADGSLDVNDQTSQRSLRTAVTRLRRLIVESDDVPDPLLHEVRACANTAERRGVAVDLQGPAGDVPALARDVRRALTEPLIQVLAATRTHARVTVAANPTDVAVAVVADAPSIHHPLPQHHRVRVSLEREEELLWMQARWRAPSPSL